MNEDHAFCVDVLQKVESTSYSAGDQREHLREFERSLGRNQRPVDRLEENVEEHHQQFLLAIQDRTGNRMDLMGGRTSLTVYQGMTHMMENAFINVKNRSHTITAEVEIPQGGADGVIIAQWWAFCRLESLHEGRQGFLRAQLGRQGALHHHRT